MKYTVERTFGDLNNTCYGWTYQNFDRMFKGLIYKMGVKICNPYIEEECNKLIFVMNPHLYHEFCFACRMPWHDVSMYKGIRIIVDPSLRIGDTKSPVGIVRLIYEGSETSVRNATFCFDNKPIVLDREHGFQKVPHIDHVKFNGPATIVFWKDGTKTVVKHDGKGRKDKRLSILYAFIRKIYGESRPYHNILNEIEEAIK